MSSASNLQPSIFDQIQADEYEQAEATQLRTAKQKAAVGRLRLSATQLKAVEYLAILTKIPPEQIQAAAQAAGGWVEFLKRPARVKEQLLSTTPKKVELIEAAIEFGKLISQPDDSERIQIRTPADAANLLMVDMSLLEREELRVICLDTKNNVITVETVYSGSLNTTVVRVAEVLRSALIHNGAGIILVHNHPSGAVEPSLEDINVTTLIREAAEKLGISVLDHVIFGRNRYLSLKEKGMGF